jgi:type I restriction enzyme S subunit
VPLKRVTEINRAALPDNTDPDHKIQYIDISAVGRGRLVSDPQQMRFGDAPSRARRLVAPGDTIVSTVRTYLRAVLPISGPTDHVIVSTGFAVVSPGKQMHHAFLSWYLQSDPFVDEVVARSNGVSYPAIAASDMGRIHVRLPPRAEQRAIADFLDTETARIDALIAKKRRMIGLLQERWQALIDRYIDGSEVPLRRLVSHFVDYRGATPEKADEGVPLVTASHIKGGLIDHSTDPQYLAPSVYEAWMRRGWPEVGDVVITTEAPLGEVAQIYEPLVALAQRVILLKADVDRADSGFLSLALRASRFQSALLANATGSTALGIKADRLKRLPVAVPDIKTQRSLVSALRSAEETKRRLQSALERQVQLLTERRQALITAAVTSELDIARTMAEEAS